MYPTLQDKPVEEKPKTKEKVLEVKSTKKPHISQLKSKTFLQNEFSPTTKDFFDVPTLDLEIDPKEDDEEFSKRKQFSFIYFGR